MGALATIGWFQLLFDEGGGVGGVDRHLHHVQLAGVPTCAAASTLTHTAAGVGEGRGQGGCRPVRPRQAPVRVLRVVHALPSRVVRPAARAFLSRSSPMIAAPRGADGRGARARCRHPAPWSPRGRRREKRQLSPRHRVPRPAELPVEYRPAATAEPFCGSGHNGAAGAVRSRRGGEGFRSARTAALQPAAGGWRDLWPPAVPVDARHGPQHLQGILHTSPKVSSDGAVGLGRSRRGSACCSTTSLYASSTRHIDHRGPRATCTPGFRANARPFCPRSGSDFGRLVLRACGVPRLHSGDAGSRGASTLAAPTHVRLSVR